MRMSGVVLPTVRRVLTVSLQAEVAAATTARLVLWLSCLCVADVSALQWQDNSVSYTYSNQFTEPGIREKVAKHIVEYVHVNSYRYGNNLFRAKVMRSDKKDPADSDDKGATEVYVVYRHFLSFEAVSGKSIGFGPISDIGLTAGFDLNYKNNAFNPRKRLFVAGPTLAFDVPRRSLLRLSLLAAKEFNHCGLPPCQVPGNSTDYEFDTFPLLFAGWRFPLRLGDVASKVEGFAAKGYRRGTDYVGNKLAHETLVRIAWLFDIGALAGGQRNALFAGIGYEYWRNKYGASDVPGTDTDAPALQLKWHF